MSIEKIRNNDGIQYFFNREELLSVVFRTDETEITAVITGAVKTIAAPYFAEIIEELLIRKKDFILDLQGVPYIASAGLRVLLNMQQRIDEEEAVHARLSHITDTVRDVLETTGFIQILEFAD